MSKLWILETLLTISEKSFSKIHLTAAAENAGCTQCSAHASAS
jgi:hypothetical protein